MQPWRWSLGQALASIPGTPEKKVRNYQDSCREFMSVLLVAKSEGEMCRVLMFTVLNIPGSIN